MFTANIGGEERALSAERVYIQGLPHVSLCALSEAVGGDCRVSPSQVRIDWRGNTASAGIDNLKVISSRKEFSLRNPIVRHENQIYIELLDAQTFFLEAFGIKPTPAGVLPPLTSQ